MSKNNLQSDVARKKIFNVFIAIILFGIAVFLIFSNWKMLGKLLDSAKYRSAAEANLKIATDRDLDLNTKLDSLATENGLDKEIRERLPVAKPGEEVIMIVSGGLNDNEEIGNGEVATNKSIWRRFIDFFKN